MRQNVFHLPITILSTIIKKYDTAVELQHTSTISNANYGLSWNRIVTNDVALVSRSLYMYFIILILHLTFHY